MEAPVVEAAFGRFRDPAADLQTDDERHQKFTSSCTNDLRRRQDGRERRRCGVVDRSDMRIIEVETVDQHTVSKGSVRRRQSIAIGQQRGFT